MKLPVCPSVSWSEGWWVCHNLLKGTEVSLSILVSEQILFTPGAIANHFIRQLWLYKQLKPFTFNTRFQKFLISKSVLSHMLFDFCLFLRLINSDSLSNNLVFLLPTSYFCCQRIWAKVSKSVEPFKQQQEKIFAAGQQ